MSARCAICAHEKRAKIEAELATGEDRLAIAQRYAVTTRGLERHEQHIEQQPAAPRSGAVSSRKGASPPPPSTATRDGEIVPLRGAAASSPCPICAHDKRADIEALAKSSASAGAVARKFLVGVHELRVHMQEHVGRAAAPFDDELPINVDALTHAHAALERARKLRREVFEDPETSMHEKQVAAKEERAAIKLVSDVESARELSESVILKSPAWARLEAALVAALQSHPDAARAVAEALQQLERVPRAEAA